MFRYALMGSLAAILCVCFVMATFLYHAQQKAFKATVDLVHCFRPDSPYKPRTGDLIILQYKNAGMHAYPGGYRDIPTHCGLVWVNENQVKVIEATRFGGDYPIADALWQRAVGDGVRAALLSDILKTVDVYCAVRPLIFGTLDSERLSHELETWAKYLRFEPAVSPNMEILDILAMGFGPGYPNVGRVCADITGLSSRHRVDVFCSEFISLLLQRLGHIDPKFQKHWSLAPVSMTSKLGYIDKLSARSSSPLFWGKEVLLVCQTK